MPITKGSNPKATEKAINTLRLKLAALERNAESKGKAMATKSVGASDCGGHKFAFHCGWGSLLGRCDCKCATTKALPACSVSERTRKRSRNQRDRFRMRSLAIALVAAVFGSSTRVTFSHPATQPPTKTLPASSVISERIRKRSRWLRDRFRVRSLSIALVAAVWFEHEPRQQPHSYPTTNYPSNLVLSRVYSLYPVTLASYSTPSLLPFRAPPNPIPLNLAPSCAPLSTIYASSSSSISVVMPIIRT
ncbi:hypothetical protein HDU99_010224 [Rhizoclosmatium hyalinum]|nr:hypothetical protein HDU99_010224 [Rhizoclosmatium hyalinum]